MTASNLSHWVALASILSIKPYTLHQLLEHFGDPASVLMAGVPALKNLGIKEQQAALLSSPDWVMVERALQWEASSTQHHLVTFMDEHYPPLLKEIADPPLMLYVWGNAHILSEYPFAMVGSRNPTSMGRELAYQYAAELAQMGVTVTSGLALGIDSASHQGALSVKRPTIAVLGSGLQCLYPKSNASLARAIAESGAVVSEYPLETQPLAFLFPRRNRIISGLCLGTLVVEASPQSGSLITARLAAEQGREVFALPGSVHNPLARGCHQLIQQGAKLTTTSQEIADELYSLVGFNQLKVEKLKESPHYVQLELEQEQILAVIGFETTSVDQIVARSQLPVSKVCTVLLILELHGYINSASGGYSRVAK